MPDSLRATYLDLVAAVHKLSDPLKNLRRVGRGLTDHYPNLLAPTLCLLDHGEAGLRQQFFRLNRLPGRLEVNLPFANVHQVLQFAALAAVRRPLPSGLDRALNRLRETQIFVILTDLVVSGRSIISDGKALRQLMPFIDGTPDPTVIAVALSSTESGATRLATHFDAVICGERLPMALSLRHLDCALGPASPQAHQVAELVRWFRRDLVVPGDLVERMERAMGTPSYGLWGFGAEGWLLAGPENTPNNAPPLLWHTPEIAPYQPPFPRTSSRLYQSTAWNLYKDYWNIIGGSNVRA